MPTAKECVAAGRSCGSPSGWRYGGRCPACRAAHSADTSKRRGRGKLTETEREIILASLRYGRTPEEAAAAADRPVVSLTRQAASDSELRLALLGCPPSAQRVARQGDYLAALTRHGGVGARAAEELGISDRGLLYWREDPAFAEAERAVRALVRGPDKAPRGRLTREMADLAAEVLEQGGALAEAGQRIGRPSTTSLRRAASSHPRLAAALPPRNQHGPSQYAEKAGQLRVMWQDSALTVSEVARELGVSAGTVKNWAKRLGLPKRRVGRRPTRDRDGRAG